MSLYNIYTTDKGYYYEIINNQKIRIPKKIYYIKMEENKSYSSKQELINIVKKLQTNTRFNRQFKLSVDNTFKQDNLSSSFNIKRFDINFNENDSITFDYDKVINKITALANINRNNKTDIMRVFMVIKESGKIFSTPNIVNRKITFTDINNLLAKLQELYAEIFLDDIEISIDYYDKIDGGKGEELPNWLKNPKAVKQIINDDIYCGHRCLVLGMLDDKQRNDLGKSRKINTLTKKAIKLANELNLDKELELNDYEIFTNKYNDYKINIYDGICKIYECGRGDKLINILYDTINKHYHLILNLKNVMKKSRNYNYCETCGISYKEFCNCDKLHSCECGEKCKIQISMTKSNPNKPYINCGKCGFKWVDNLDVSKLTKDNHICKDCGDLYNDKRGIKCIKVGNKFIHKCNENKYYCRTCDRNIPNCEKSTHRCIIPKIKLSKTRQEKYSKLANVYSYDMESLFLDGNFHKPHLIKCKNRFNDEMITFETNEQKDCMDMFITFIMKQKECVFIAHNGKSYDTWLLFRHLKRHYKKRPKNIVYAGSKIMFMEYDKVLFLDSLNHIQSTLEGMPKIFGLDETQFKKGFYPYMFNTKENQNYVGLMPDIKYFDCNNMKTKKRKEFIKWYNQKVKDGYIWEHKKETNEYCNSDVEILDQALKVYSEESFNLNGIDALHFPTIAKYCMTIYKLHHYNIDKYPLYVLKKDEYDFIKRGFHGGRTEAIQYKKSYTDEDLKNGKYAKYQDIQSLYPSAQYYDQLPYGKPITKIYDNQDNINDNHNIINNNYGFFEVDYICNKNLYIPALVEYENGKLLASLNDKNKVVVHSEELKKAIACGYKITKIYKSITFDTTCEMFKTYVAKFLEIKVNCSGCDLEGEEYNEWIKEHEKRFNFTPKPNKNKGKKLIAKLCLNSLWGKFSQRIDMPKTEYCDLKKWNKLRTLYKNGEIKIENLVVDNFDTIMIKYTDQREYNNQVLQQTNIGLGASVTAMARLRLYDELYKLGDRVLYHDTDSIIYEYDINKYNIEEGKYLGEWEEEDVGPIKEFIGCGAKTYSYIGFNEYTDCKSKGLTLNHQNSKKINHQSYKNLVESQENKKEKIIRTSKNMRFEKSENGIQTIFINKDFKLTNDKRCNIGNYNSLPFGHIKVC